MPAAPVDIIDREALKRYFAPAATTQAMTEEANEARFPINQVI
jgi:hypothetical protein